MGGGTIDPEDLESILLFHIGLYGVRDTNTDTDTATDAIGGDGSGIGAALSYPPAFGFDDLPCKGLLVTASDGRSSRTKCEHGEKFQKGPGNDNDNHLLLPRIVQPDLFACYGHIVHLVDGVLLPFALDADSAAAATAAATTTTAAVVRTADAAAHAHAHAHAAAHADADADAVSVPVEEEPPASVPTEAPEGTETWYPSSHDTSFGTSTYVYGTYAPTDTAYPTMYYYRGDGELDN
eukprot:jgi/Psemu1/304004/fgenesh1_kg.131_\